MATKDNMTCGEYLWEQRRQLNRIDDLSVPGVKEQAKELLANIYAVSYQMTCNRIEPPGPERGPAAGEPLDRELVCGTAEKLRRAPELQYLVDDPWRLSEAIHAAKQGNGFPLIEMVHVAHLARTAEKAAPERERAAERAPEREKAAEPARTAGGVTR